MKEDILEQVVDDYLQAKGYFTRHNVKFLPSKTHHEFAAKADSVPSDIDVIGLNPHLRGHARVLAVSCKSWQGGFNVRSRLSDLEENKFKYGRETWKSFRELMKPKWSEAFCDAIERETGSTRFTYVTAVTRLSGNRSDWEQSSRFRKAMRGNMIRLLTLSEILAEMLPGIKRIPASSDLGRTLQLLKASGFLSSPKGRKDAA